jgi:hypothetical protein
VRALQIFARVGRVKSKFFKARFTGQRTRVVTFCEFRHFPEHAASPASGHTSCLHRTLKSTGVFRLCGFPNGSSVLLFKPLVFHRFSSGNTRGASSPAWSSRPTPVSVNL